MMRRLIQTIEKSFLSLFFLFPHGSHALLTMPTMPPQQSTLISFPLEDAYDILPYTDHPQYKRLMALLEHIQQSIDMEQETTVPVFSLHPASPHLSLLALRLKEWGFPLLDSSFPSVVAMLKEFQKSHGLAQSGRLDPITLKTLNRPLKVLAQTLKKNQEKWEKLGGYHANHVLINIPAFYLHVFKEAKIALSCPVVVGKNKSKTPIFSAYITSIVTHPIWMIPPSLVEKLKGNVGSKGYVWQEGRLIKLPGPHNDLGNLKFPVRDSHGILLHGTKKPHYFQYAQRNKSHGCIRVRDTLPLACELLPQKEKAIKAALDQKKTRTFTLPQEFPVYALYLTAWVTEKGMPRFYRDVYGMDQKHQEDEED
jgi:murein L,D-transpeptidase YcbB/YkuD